MKTKIEFKNQLWLPSKRLAVICAGLLLAVSLPDQAHAAPGDVDLSFDPGSTVNGMVRAIAVQDDGKVLIGGDFTTVHNAVRRGIARFMADGSVDDSFVAAVVNANLAGDFAPVVDSVVLQGDGKVLIGGSFTSVNGVARTNLARLNADGSLDESFLCLPAVNGNVSEMVLVEEDQILVQGEFTSVNGVARTNLARLNADGSLDASFFAAVAGEVGCVALQNDGKILIGGNFTAVGGFSRTNVARLNADGTLDRSFLEGMAGASGWVVNGHTLTSIAVQNDGKVLIAGYFSWVNGGVARQGIARLNADGTLDETFVGSVRLFPTIMPVLALQPDSKILVGTIHYDSNNVPRGCLGRLNSDGTLDYSFFAPLSWIYGVGVFCIVPRTEGGVLVGGAFQYITTAGTIPYFCQLDTTGAPDSSFGLGDRTGPTTEVSCLAVQPDGTVLVGGYFTSLNGVTRSNLARLRPDGAVDTAFLNGLAGTDSVDEQYKGVLAIAVQSDGKVLIGGSFNTVNGVARSKIARLNADGTLDNSFLTGVLGGVPMVDVIAIQSDGKILIGGSFKTVNGFARGGIARLNENGTLDGSFMNSLAGANISVRSLAVQSDGKILIGGDFSSVNGVGRAGLARLNVNGSLDTSLTASLGSATTYWYNVFALVQQSDGKILIGGEFRFVNGTARTNLARLNANGTLDTSFLSGLVGPNSVVKSLAVQPDGRVLIGGSFTDVNGLAQSHLARLNADGTLDSTFVCSADGVARNSGDVNAIVLPGSGKILIGGLFTLINQTPRSFVARLMVGEYIPVTILTPPSSQTVEVGSAAQFSVVAAGYGPLNYQWFFNDSVPVSAATTNASWELPNVQSAQTGSYAVLVANDSGAVTSAPALLNVIPVVEPRPVPGIMLFGEAGSTLNLEYAEALGPAPAWWPLATVSLASPPQFEFDLAAPLPPQRFYRAWQTGMPAVLPSLNLNFVPAITLTGDVSSKVRVDGINQFGPTDAWFTLDTVTLTNTSQLYFDDSVIGQPQRLYRLVPVP